MVKLVMSIVACLVALGVAAAEEPLPAPFPPGVKAGHRLCEMTINGPTAGKAVSMICYLAGRPAVLIYAREFDPALEKLLVKLDIVARQGKAEKMLGACVLLTDKDADKGVLEQFDRRANLESMILATTPPLDDNRYFGAGRRDQHLSPEAAVTVIFFEKLTVRSSHAFRKGELTERKITEMVNSLAALLPPLKI